MNFTCAGSVWAEKLTYKGQVLVRSCSTRNAINMQLHINGTECIGCRNFRHHYKQEVKERCLSGG